MAKERDLQLLDYDISDNRYRELKYFCRQYKEKQKRLRSITELSSHQCGAKRSGGISDRTATVAIKKAQLAAEIKMIEQSALEADGELYGYILENVTEGVSYEYLDIPASRAGFYALRRSFFYILDKRR
ncbi:MAG: hypothetical protein EOM28_04875 [Clostridia bacterium]|nr:hypothetical protein [Clostridia bacterium]